MPSPPMWRSPKQPDPIAPALTFLSALAGGHSHRRGCRLFGWQPAVKGCASSDFELVIGRGVEWCPDLNNSQIVGRPGLAKGNSGDNDDVLPRRCKAFASRGVGGSSYHVFIVADIGVVHAV